jgi:hypothetical protein
VGNYEKNGENRENLGKMRKVWKKYINYIALTRYILECF